LKRENSAKGFFIEEGIVSPRHDGKSKSVGSCTVTRGEWFVTIYGVGGNSDLRRFIRIAG